MSKIHRSKRKYSLSQPWTPLSLLNFRQLLEETSSMLLQLQQPLRSFPSVGPRTHLNQPLATTPQPPMLTHLRRTTRPLSRTSAPQTSSSVRCNAKKTVFSGSSRAKSAPPSSKRTLRSEPRSSSKRRLLSWPRSRTRRRRRSR